VKGEASHVELQDHITSMGVDRFKKAARSILDFALNTELTTQKGTPNPFPRADVLLLERLAGFIPDAERERGIKIKLTMAELSSKTGLELKQAEEVVAKIVKAKIMQVLPDGFVISDVDRLRKFLEYLTMREQFGDL
jgi:hypothetical protein